MLKDEDQIRILLAGLNSFNNKLFITFWSI